MHFCDNCSNMYYIKLNNDDGNKLVYYCRNCGNEDSILTAENICVSKTQIQKNEQKYSRIINPYTKLDPTLPRINNIPCPNSQCVSKSLETTKNPDIIYIRYDDSNMKYVYLCTVCDTTWKTSEHN
jgi:DNA-directed RNA polymerase subunit M/transcription elongation factor TFIIS